MLRILNSDCVTFTRTFLVTVTVLDGDAGIASIAFRILLLVSMVTTLKELSIMHPLLALGRTHSTDSHLVQISYTIVQTRKMHHISEPLLKAPIINIGHYFLYSQTNFTYYGIDTPLFLEQYMPSFSLLHSSDVCS